MSKVTSRTHGPAGPAAAAFCDWELINLRVSEQIRRFGFGDRTASSFTHIREISKND